MKQVIFKVDVMRVSQQAASIEVPVSLDTTSHPATMEAAEHIAALKARDAVHGKITLAAPIVWKAPADADPVLVRIVAVKPIGSPKPPTEAYSLVCSNILSIVRNGHGEIDYLQFSEGTCNKIVDGIRWLDDNHEFMTKEVKIRLRHVKDILADMKAPDELTRTK
jgi:hypothetical protein